MRAITTLEKVINTVHEQSATNYDEMVPVQDMQFSSLEQMGIAGQSFGMLPSAQRLLANRLRVPFSYLSRCPEELQAENLNYWIRQEAVNRESLFCRFAGNSVRAVFTERYTVIDHMEVLMKMLEYGFDPAGEIQISLDSEIMLLKMPEYARTFLLAENDKVVPGISISNSEVGVLALSIEAFYYRLVCTNGMIANNRRELTIQAHQQKSDGRIPHDFGRRRKPIQATSRPVHDFHPNPSGRPGKFH